MQSSPDGTLPGFNFITLNTKVPTSSLHKLPHQRQEKSAWSPRMVIALTSAAFLLGLGSGVILTVYIFTHLPKRVHFRKQNDV